MHADTHDRISFGTRLLGLVVTAISIPIITSPIWGAFVFVVWGPADQPIVKVCVLLGGLALAAMELSMWAEFHE